MKLTKFDVVSFIEWSDRDSFMREIIEFLVTIALKLHATLLFYCKKVVVARALFEIWKKCVQALKELSD